MARKPKQNYKPGPKDNCQTPGYALEPLFHFCGDEILSRGWKIWEPAVGEGYLEKELRELVGIDSVIATGLPDYDFLLQGKYPNNWWEDGCIITNPPFSRKKEFTEKCYVLMRPWALLMPTETVSLGWFHALVERWGEPGIIWFSPRVSFKMPNKGWEWIDDDPTSKTFGELKHSSSQIPTAWFTWKMGFTGNRYINMSHWKREYRKRFET